MGKNSNKGGNKNKGNNAPKPEVKKEVKQETTAPEKKETPASAPVVETKTNTTTATPTTAPADVVEVTEVVEVTSSGNVPAHVEVQNAELQAAMASGKLDTLARYFGLEKKHNHLSADGEVMLLNIINQRIVNWDPNDKITISVGRMVDKRLIRRLCGVFVQDGLESNFGTLKISEDMYPIFVESFADFGVHLPAPTIAKELDENGKKQLEIDFQEATVEDAAIIKIRREREIEARMHTLEQDPSKWENQQYAADVITSWFTADKVPEGIDDTKVGYLDDVFRKVINCTITYLDTQKIPTQIEGIDDWTKVPKNQVVRTILFDLVPQTPTMLYAGIIKTATNYLSVLKHPLLIHLKLKDRYPDFTDEEIKDIIVAFCEIRAKHESSELENTNYYKNLTSSTVIDYTAIVTDRLVRKSCGMFIQEIINKFSNVLGDPADSKYNANILNTILTLDNIYKETPNNLVNVDTFVIEVKPAEEAKPKAEPKATEEKK